MARRRELADEDDERDLELVLAGLPELLAEVSAAIPGAGMTTVKQLLCPLGRLAGGLDEACDYDGCPWACGDSDVPDRRAEIARSATTSGNVRLPSGTRSAGPPRSRRALGHRRSNGSA